MKRHELTRVGTVYRYADRTDIEAMILIERHPSTPPELAKLPCGQIAGRPDAEIVVLWSPPPDGPENGIAAKDVAAMGDMKAALRGGKPDITHVRTPLLNYIARACEYGNDKYERSNYLRQTSSLKSDFERYRAYLRAMISHAVQTLDAMEAHQATDPKLEDKEGMRKAAFAVDTDPDKTGKVGPSNLPHICGAGASLMMAITQAVQAGLLPADPGTPWRK